MINDYFNWLKSETTFGKINEYYEITLPYLNHDNDYVQIYIKQGTDGLIHMTDDSYTLSLLEAQGINLSIKRKEILNKTLSRYGVNLSEKEITCIATPHNFSEKKHMFLQALLTIDDMHMLSKGKVQSIFIDDVQKYLDSNDIYYSENIQFPGKSGYPWNYDFLIQRSKNSPERICKAINTANKQNINNTLFAWTDTKQVRRDDSKLVLFLNDEKNIPESVISACQNYESRIILWSKRQEPESLNFLSA